MVTIGISFLLSEYHFRLGIFQFSLLYTRSHTPQHFSLLYRVLLYLGQDRVVPIGGIVDVLG